MRSIVAIACVAAICVAAIIPTSAQQDADSRKKLAAEMLDRLHESSSLRWNARQMQSYARYEGDDVIPRLLAIYNRPPAAFSDNMRYLAASYIRDRHDVPAGADMRSMFPRKVLSAKDIAALEKFMKSDGKRVENVWAAYCFASILALERNDEINLRLLQIIGDDKAPAVIRAAVLEALSRAGCDFMRRVLEILLTTKTRKTADDVVIFEAATWAVARTYRGIHREGEPVPEDWRPLFDAIAARLDDPKDTTPRSKREAALSLQYAFNTTRPYAQAAMWRMVFDHGKDPASDEGSTVASFMGLDVLGERIIFIIDASDSMLNPLGDEDLETLKGPVTGERGRRNKGEYEIDWRKVKNRFDVAREHVKWTLSRLDKDKQVAVLLFGSSVEPLAFTRTFVQASSGNVSRIHAALDGIRPGKASAEMAEKRPHGVLLGETNYYEALLAAYRMGKGGIVNQPREHWDQRLILEGADAIFLLSDGAPIRDGFSGASPVIDQEYDSWSLHDTKQSGEGEWVDFPARPAQPEREVEVRDPETGIVTKRKYPGYPEQPATRKWRKKEKVRYQYSSNDDNGPYANTSGFVSTELNNLLAEVERMNLVRRCLIQCVGIGEANMSWLRPIATRTGGKAVYFGKDGEKAAGPGSGSPFPDGFPDFD
jgi:hypothetical protein